MMKNFLAGLFLLLLVVGCSQTPTKVYQTSPLQTAQNGAAAIEITTKTVLVDARPAFDYSLAHLSGAINLRPEDFTQRETPFLGLLDTDLYFHTRKLARLGISPETPVVVVGRGAAGKGEEGRVAWTLRYLGVKNVQFASVDYFKLPLVSAETEPRRPEALWKPQLDDSLIVGRKEFVRRSMKPHPDFVIIDARPSVEYLGKAHNENIQSVPDMGAINIPWTDFLDLQGMVNLKVKEKLESIGITADKKIYVVGNRGVESALVTMALRALGYSHAANYAGGYLELVSEKK